ncbi:MAG: nucleotide exchange factor GrpE [Candidatus Cryosericum sp.]
MAGEERGDTADSHQVTESTKKTEPDVLTEQAEDDGGEALRALGAKIRELQLEVERLNSAVHEEQMLRIREQATLQRDKNSFEARTRLALFSDLLAVVDSFDQLVKHGEKTRDGSDLFAGSQAVLAQLNQFLSRNGVHRIEGIEGQAYDSATSEIARVVTDQSTAPNNVVAVLRDGYMLGEMLLRPAMVEVAAAPSIPVENDDIGED